MRTTTRILMALWMATQAVRAEAQWLTSVPEAMAQAKAENKTVLLDFTGSDWCGWCMKLKAETLSKPDFLDYAREHLVLVEVDFPRRSSQPAELQEANKALQEKYDVHGYPTLIQLSPDGTVLMKQQGYLAGGPDALITKLGGFPLQVPTPTTAPPPLQPVNLAVAFHGAPAARKTGDEPRLQGIFYSSSHPSILLDGKNCEPGDSVAGMRVLKIAPDKVTVDWRGQTKELVMK